MISRIANGRTDLVFEFLDQNGDPSATDAGGTSLLQWCAYYGDVSSLKYLISKGASIESLGVNLDLNGAAFHGHWQLCQFLIEHGADVNHPMEISGERPLHVALSSHERLRHDRVVRVLLAHGADPNTKTTPSMETGCFMRDCRTKGETPLHRAAAFGNESTIRLLLDAGAVVNTEDHNGDTPLSWASWYARPDSILRLLCYGDHHRIREDRDPDGLASHLLGEPS